VLSASADHTLRLWDVASGQTLHVLDGQSWLPVSACAFSPDGRLVLSASGYSLRLWDVGTGQTLQVLERHGGPVNACAFSPDGHLVLSASDDQTLRLWDVASGQMVHELSGHTSPVSACAFSPDGRLVLSVDRHEVAHLWDVRTGQAIHEVAGHGPRRLVVEACAFSPDGRLALAASQDGSLWLWDVASGQRVHILVGRGDWFGGCAFTPDAQLILSACGRQLLLWDSARGSQIACFVADGAVTCLAFTPRARRVVAGDGRGGVHFLTVEGLESAFALPRAEFVEPMPGTSPGATVAAHPQSPARVLPTVPEQRAVVRRWWPFGRRRVGGT
jgi:WD40 repeat protein